MNTEPVYQGEKPPAGGQVIRCACGQLATHRARYLRNDGGLGTWTDAPVCERCGRAKVVTPDPPPKTRPVPRLGATRSARPQMAAPTRVDRQHRRPAVLGHLT